MRRAPSLLAAALCLLSLPAAANDVGQAIALEGDGRGAAPCAGCHGADGAGNAAAGFPALAALDPDYLARQAALIRDGERAAPAMAPAVQTLTDGDLAAVASWYAGLPPAPAAPPPAGDDVALGAALAAVGDWPGRDLPACESCHGPGARGAGPAFPRLAGQHAAYLAAQLRAFQSGARATDPGGLMSSVAARLTEQEILAVSAWLAAQPAEVSR